MKKNSRLKSFFAILLAVSMIFQQSSLTVLATDDTYVEDATATPTPAENEAETYATEGAEPVAEKQEKPQQVQETPAAEQAQEPMEAPAEQPTEAPAEQPTEAPAEQPTEAPAEQPTEAPAAAPTETPATEPTAAPAAEVTEVPAAPEATATPAAEATATPTPEVSASPSETPTPAPTETPKTSFRYEDSRVVITATAPEDANLPQDAEIKADYIAPGTDRYNAAVAAFNSQLSSQLGLDAENTEAEYVLYDVYFLTADGSRIEPENGNVKVDMSFKQIQESTVDGDIVNKNVVHLDNDGQAEVVTEYVNTNADGEITSMGFTQDSFSIVGGVTTTITRASNPNVITSVALSFKENGESGSASIDSIKSGKEGYLFASIGMANNNDHIVTSDVEINLGKTNAKFPDFVNNTYVANGITYTLSTDADGNQKIKVEGLTENGSTQLIKMRVKFPEGVSSSKDDINASFTVDGENKANASLKCEAEPKWHHKKTADNVSIGTTGTTTSFVMKDDLKFTLHEYHDEIKEGNLWLKGFTITDTMRFPEGMYINKDDADAAISFENMDGYKKNLIYDKNDSNKVVGYTITYTKSSSSEDPKKQLDDWTGKVIVSKDKIKFVENYVDGEVSNELETTVSPIDNSADIKLADKAKATVLVKKPGEIDFRDNNNNNKSILHVETAKPGHWNDYNQNNSYVLYGDYILYQVKATNNGDVDTDIVIEDDLTKVSPARSLAFITEDELNTLSTNGQWNVGGNAFTPSKRIWTKADSPIKATAEIAGDKATWKFESVPSGKEVLGYVLMKVVQNETQEITNQITINNDKATKTNTVKQKKDEEKMEVTKTASAEPIVDGKEEYTITIKNTGTAAASGWKFSDVLPAGMELDGTVAKVTIEGGSFTSEVTYDSVTGEIAGTLADIQPGGSVTIKVPVKLKSNSTEESFKNVAQVIKGEHVVKGEVTVHKNSRNFDITKTADRTLADSEDLVKYTITVKNTGISSSVLTENEPLAFWDIPNGITIEENKQSDKFVENKPNDVTIERVYEKDGNGKITKVIFKAVGTFKTGESASVNVWATMPKVETGSVKVKNTAEIDENHKSDSEIVVEPSQGDSTETKVVYDKDGNPLPNPGVVSVGDVLTYKITVKNTGKSNITEVYGKDTLVNKDNSNGATHQVDDANNNYQLILTVEEAEEVTGINKGDKLVINKWDVKDFSFLITTNSNSQKSADVIKKIEDFSIAPNGKLVLSYKLKLKDNFKDSYNQVSINGHEPVTSFEYTTAEGKLDVFKYAGGSLGEGNSFEPNNLDKTFSLNPNDYSSAADLQNKLIIPYVVVVKNLSEKGGSQILDDFVVTDTLPEGLEWVKYDETKDVLVKVAADNNKNTWDSESSWGKVSASVSGNTITTRFSKAVQGYNGDKICLLIFYKARLTSEKAEEIYKKLKDSKDSLVLETFKNTATLKATKPFINSEGKVGTETSDSDNFTIEEDTTHISFEKAAEGCYAGGEDYNGQLTTIGGTAGSKIVWKLVINNDTYGNGGAALTNYSILDTLPSGYQYQKSKNGEYKNTMIVYSKSDGTLRREIPFVEPTIDTEVGTIAWNFDTAKNSEFKLEPGEYLEIKYATSIRSTDDSKDGIYTNHAKLTVHGYTEPGTVPGKDDFDKEYEDSASYTLSSVATSSVKTIAYNRHANHKKDPKDDTGSGDRPMPENYVEGMQGEDVTYTLNVKNEATATTIANMVVIDRLPYVGDIGVIAGYGRGSAFEVSYNGGLAVSVDGSTINGVTVQFSSDASTTIGDGAGEWSTEKDNDTVKWHDEYQAGDRLIRFQFPADFKLPAGKTVTIQFNGKVPEYVENTGESNIAWNSFAYSYTDEGKTSGILIAEPAKVGVWVKTPESGKITVNKTFKSENTERTFYFAVFTRNENNKFVRYSPVKSLTLTGTTTGTTESVVFNNLPLGEENETIYYVFETDAQGNILTLDKDGKANVNGINYTVTYQKTDVVLSEGKKEQAVSITNEEEKRTIEISGTKTWDDNSNQDGLRPEKVELKLYRKVGTGDEELVQGVKATWTNTNSDTWNYSFESLPEYENQQKITYRVEETPVKDYETSYDTTNKNNITNTHKPGTVKISGTKTWDDNSNQDGLRPEKVELKLYRKVGTGDEELVQGVKATWTNTNSDTWNYSFESLPEYENQQKITYRVEETPVKDYETSYDTTNKNNITNTHKPGTVKISGTKTWDDNSNQDGLRPEKVELKLYRTVGNGKEEPVEKEATWTNTAGDIWSYSFGNLPEYENQQKITYRVAETPVKDYETSYDASNKNNITNTHKPGTVDIEGTKTWNDNGNADIRPETITINLYANGKLVASKTVSKADDWKWKFADQPKYEKGKEIEYTITEDKVDGYITTKGIGDYDVINTPTTVIVDKVDDKGNPVKDAQLQITVKDSNGNAVASWKTDETSYDIIGKLIAGNTYILEEINVPTGYVAADPITFKVEADGTITVDNETIVGNKLTLVDAKLHFNVNKVELGNGKEVEGAHLVVIDKETGKTVDEWVSEKGKTHDFGPKLEAGKSYILRETVAPAGYKYATDIEFTVKKDGTIETNAKTTTDTDGNKVYLVEDDTTKVTITKVDALGNQLSGVVLEIQDKDGVVIDSWTTSTKDNPRVITGKLILGETYKLVEKSAPAGYTLADPVEFTVSENDIDNKVEMKNTYSASGSLNLTAKKTLTTTETPLTEGQFTFELRDKDGTVLQTKTNDADGNVTFDEIKYSLVKDNTDKKVDDTGEYQYTVNEVKGDAAGYTYDDTIYTINATVTDAGNGTLTVTPVIHSSKATSEDATVTGMEFTNTYTTSGQIALGATKTLEGQTLEAEQFSFQATEMDADGKAVENGYNETVKNADGGTITFPIITYKESGTHYYQITEVKDEKPAYQYDESKYVVKVDVTDDNAGKLTAKVTSVTKNGEPVKSEDLTGAVTFTNTYSASADLELKAQKSMKVEAEQLGTFEFELKDADGKVIETVKNDEKGAISFSKLSYTEKDAGKTFTYTVNEKLPSEADTYVYDKTVYTVTVNVEDNRDGTLKLTTKVNGEDYTETAMKFVNDTTKVTISKVDDTTLKALAGAKLQVVDDQDKVVEEWTSDGTPHVITAKLVLGKTYKLVEAEAPSGYEIAEPITFTVDADDTKNAVEMKDAMTKSKTAAIEITKELKLNDALAGAKDMTFYAALFADAECTIPASDVKALEFKNASSSTVTFTNLDLGRTYYVSETDVTGKAIDSGMTPDEKVYVPVYPQGQAITVTEDGAKSSITFENQFSEWPDGFYKIATLNVTKKLLGADGNALESDEIFYAGIFDDKECTTLSTRTEKNILTLDLAGGSTVSESTQAVVIPDESFTLYVAETDAEGNLVGGTDGFRYAVTVENGNVLFDENNLNAEVTIINQEQPEATPTVTPEETITPTPTPGTSTGVKTGDDTPIGFYMALLFVAALAIEETTRRRRKKERD
ncbi:MAG: Cna B-type domain-containing protein [Blautia faecis]